MPSTCWKNFYRQHDYTRSTPPAHSMLINAGLDDEQVETAIGEGRAHGSNHRIPPTSTPPARQCRAYRRWHLCRKDQPILLRLCCSGSEKGKVTRHGPAQSASSMRTGTQNTSDSCADSPSGAAQRACAMRFQILVSRRAPVGYLARMRTQTLVRQKPTFRPRPQLNVMQQHQRFANSVRHA